MKDNAPASRWSHLPIIGPVVRFFRRTAMGAAASDGLSSSERKTYHCGTLTYTKAGLVAIFAWLLWGDFCFTIMETVCGILPLQLHELKCDDWLLSMILGTIPNILNMTVCPAVSFKSDRHRGKWGRRIPFIVWTMPFLCLSLVMLGYSKDIGLYLQVHTTFLRSVAPATITVALIAIFLALFQFFNMFVASVFYYLFNDVVPARFLARFTGMFRIVGNLAGALYSYFIFKYALTNMREILVGASVLYFVGFTLMCLMVKEGEYPPVEAEEAKASQGLRGMMTFLKESFCHKWYWIFFLWTNIGALGSGIGVFGVFFNQEMGLSLDDIGKLGAITAVAGMIAMYVAAVFIDRWTPMRVCVYSGIFSAFAALSSWIWIFVTLPGRFFFWLCLGGGLIGAFFAALAGQSAWPLLMRTFPKSRFGQFCSAQALVRSGFALVSGLTAGLYLDGIRWLCRGSGHGLNFPYRFNFLWPAFFALVGAALSIWAYIVWNRRGGDHGYKPPAPWNPDGIEELDLVPGIGPQYRWLSLSLRLFDASIGLPVLILLALMWWMHRCHALIAFRWYVILVLPCSLAVWIVWKFLERGIRNDMARCLNKEPLYNGIPHHGIMMAVAVQYLLAVGMFVAQIIVTIKLNMERECMLFGISNVVTNLLLIASVLVIWRMERGWSNTLEMSGPGDD